MAAASACAAGSRAGFGLHYLGARRATQANTARQPNSEIIALSQHLRYYGGQLLFQLSHPALQGARVGRHRFLIKSVSKNEALCCSAHLPSSSATNSTNRRSGGRGAAGKDGSLRPSARVAGAGRAALRLWDAARQCKAEQFACQHCEATATPQKSPQESQ